MSEIIVRWHNPEQTIFIFEFPLVWKWAEFMAAQAVSTEMMNRRSHDLRVGIAFTLPAAGKLPTGEMPAAIKALATRDKRVVKIVMVTQNGYARMMWQALSGLFPDGAKSYGIADSVETAMTMITARFAELNRSEV